MHRATRTRPHGFTLTELMAVVAIIAILAVVYFFTARPNQSQAEMDDFAGDVIGALKEARGRAIANGVRYAVEIKSNTVQYCQTDCPDSNHRDDGMVRTARGDARAVTYARVSDIGIGALPSRTNLTSGSTKVYFYPDGTADSDLSTTQQDGFTVYLQHQVAKNLQYRVTVLPLSGDIRKYTEW